MAAKKFVIARQLGGKRVITNKGEEIGRIKDVLIDETSSKISSLVIEPNNDSRVARNLMKYEGMEIIPFKSVFAVSDVIVVDEGMLV